MQITIDKAKHKKILSISLPAALNSLLDMLQVIVDLMMVGTISAFAVAAVGLGLQSLTFVFAVLTLLHVGTNALLARFIGAGHILRASSGLSTLLGFALLLALPVTALWYLLAPQIYLWFDTAVQVVSLGDIYVIWLTWMLPFVFVRIVFTTALSASGDTKTPMFVKLFSIMFNITLNYLLIFGHYGFPALGVAGAAIATVIVNILEVAVYLWLYLTHRTPYLPRLHFSAPLLQRALRVGLPASLERTLSFGSLMLFTAIIAQFGTEALAGYQIGLRVEGIAFMPGIGFTIAAMALMGQGLGRGMPQLARNDVILVLKYATALMFSLSFFMVFTPHWLVAPFSNDPQTLQQASLYLQIVGLSQIPLAFSFVLSGALRGAGDTKTTLRINLLTMWFVRIVPGFVLGYSMQDIRYVYYAMIADTFVKAWLLWRAFDKGKWAKIRV